MAEYDRGTRRRYRSKFLILFSITFILLTLLNSKEVSAIDFMPEDINYSEIQDVINDVLQNGNAIEFGTYVEDLINGEESFSFEAIGKKFIESIRGEFKANVSTFARLISIALIAAIFTNLSMAFKNNQVSETGYYITYLLLFSLLISSFITASRIAASTIGDILEFMKALVPSYFLAVGFCTGSTTSLVYYQIALVLISLVDLLIVRVVIPLINFYLIIMLANNLSKEDMLSKLAGLLATVINWMLKSLLAAVIGFQAIQGLIVPVADQVKRSALLKASSAIPGIGNAIGSVTETVLGAGVLLKNAIGVAGLIVILTICAVPIIKLLVLNFIYRCGSAALQPISDKRIIECISASAKSAGMLLETVFVAAVLFILTITIVAVTTGGSF